jgi:Cu(I)/Ag(I) efflux system membrane protein CusA/SilA
MIERTIDWCASNRFLVFTGTVILTVWGIWAMTRTPLDAVPDISDVQVIVSTEWMGRSPDLIEDQITYPIVSALISTPKVKAVRGFTDFGISYVYVIFQDGTDMYWAGSRVVEYLQGIRGQLPEDTNPVIGPDATGLVGCSDTPWWTRPASTLWRICGFSGLAPPLLAGVGTGLGSRQHGGSSSGAGQHRSNKLAAFGIGQGVIRRSR